LAVEEKKFNLLLKIWVWGKEVQLKPNDIKNKLLLAEDKDGYNARHRKAESGTLELLQTLWDWAKEMELNPQELLLTQTGTE